MKVTVNIGDDDLVKDIIPGVETKFSLPLRYIVEDGKNLDIHVTVQPENGPRSLVDILAEAVQHGKDNPDHGGNCACLDRLMGEIKHQVISVIPDSTAEPDWTRRTDARWRVTYLLNAASRYI